MRLAISFGVAGGGAGPKRENETMEFMRDGGFGMWLMLATAIVLGGVAVARKGGARASLLAAGTVIILLEGLLSIGLNLEAVSAHYAQFPNPVEALGAGIGEAANAAWFASLLAAVLGVGSLASRRGGGDTHISSPAAR